MPLLDGLTEPITCSSCGAVSVNGGVLHCHRCYTTAIAKKRVLWALNGTSWLGGFNGPFIRVIALFTDIGLAVDYEYKARDRRFKALPRLRPGYRVCNISYHDNSLFCSVDSYSEVWVEEWDPIVFPVDPAPLNRKVR